MKVLDISSGNAHFRFFANLGSTLVRVRCDWLSRYEYFTVSIYQDDELLIAGRALHPGMNLIEDVDIPGSLILEGEAPTPQNLGEKNRLIYRGEA